MALSSRRRGILPGVELLRPYSNHTNPSHRGGHRQVVQAPCVVDIADYGPVRNVGTERVENGGANPLPVYGLPVAFTAQPHHHQAYEEHDFFCEVECVEIAPIRQFIVLRILPGNDSKEVEIHPPSQEQDEIEPTESRFVFTLRRVWLQRNGGHHGNEV